MAEHDLIPEPTARRLRIFAFDPSVSAQVETAGVAEIPIAVPWEEHLKPGPRGEYVEVIDADPASEVFYKPINLNDPRILAQDGLAPSESNPQFHQQMVYAVAMTTIEHFERALGRVALWSSHGRGRDEQFVRRLRIYPHALRDRNAYYSPEKKALLFGYFPVNVKDANNTPGTLVFTCLSHDIIAHETTHALLDGVHPRFNEPVNQDVLAFHEAFADIVALFQHFSYPGVLRDQIARTRGNLANESLLGQLAQQFGKASGRGSALRDALGRTNENTGRWEPHMPDVRALDATSEPHARGAILVAAVFGAFLKVYRARTADLYRIASEGTGVLRAGDIHPDLANRLADEAARCAQNTLQICIRAIDYCPPVGISFGDYLRAIVTADTDFNPDESAGYRLAFVESFRQWGIHPHAMQSMSAEGLLWPTGAAAAEEAGIQHNPKGVKSLITEERTLENDEEPSMPERPSIWPGVDRLKPWNLESNRFKTWAGVKQNARVLWSWLLKGAGQSWAPAIGIVLKGNQAPPTVFRSKNGVAVEVHSVRTALRRNVRGETVTDLVVEITQRRRGYFDAATQTEKDTLGNAEPTDDGDFIYRAGCTLLINPATMEVRRVIRTAGAVDDNQQLERVRRFLTEGGLEPGNAFEAARQALHAREPFALLHHHEEE